MQVNEKTKRILNLTTRILAWILIAFTVFMVIFTVVTVTTVDKNDRVFLGRKMYIVTSNSMSPSENNKDMDVHFKAGDIVLVKNLDDEEKLTLKKGDVISFVSTNSDNYLETVTHMILRPVYDKDNAVIGYVTFGTNTGAQDKAVVTPEYILGKYTGKLPGVGNFFAFVKSTPGYILCILVPFLLLILYNGMNVIRLFRKYKGEQTAAMEAERAEIAAERAETQRMMAELLALKAQLEKTNAAEPAATPPEETSEK